MSTARSALPDGQAETAASDPRTETHALEHAPRAPPKNRSEQEEEMLRGKNRNLTRQRRTNTKINFPEINEVRPSSKRAQIGIGIGIGWASQLAAMWTYDEFGKAYGWLAAGVATLAQLLPLS
jgi:hypothetical protein